MARLTKTARAVHAAQVTADHSREYAADLARQVEREAVQLATMITAHEALKARAERARVAAERDAAALANLTTTVAAKE